MGKRTQLTVPMRMRARELREAGVMYTQIALVLGVDFHCDPPHERTIRNITDGIRPAKPRGKPLASPAQESQ